MKKLVIFLVIIFVCLSLVAIKSFYIKFQAVSKYETQNKDWKITEIHYKKHEYDGADGLIIYWNVKVVMPDSDDIRPTKDDFRTRTGWLGLDGTEIYPQ